MGTTPADGFDRSRNRVADVMPQLHVRQDSPYTLPNERYEALRAVLHDVGGQIDVPAPLLEKGEEAWEMNTYVTCECLGWRGHWNSEMRRRAENDLGATLYFGLPYYARWITVATKTLIDKSLIRQDDLAAKIDEVRERLRAQRADSLVAAGSGQGGR
ncbi:nitrile hydratase subunit beta [Streptomyces sp. SHP 1-2]|uniref:hypothetical protein n=1 Tax=Streptomyces sp. NPDC052077 TaxID=3154757 RepID=UPI002240E5DB|nr:nitrile hydratase subunit beta [Streptomyces sp. SHP 1-2]